MNIFIISFAFPKLCFYFLKNTLTFLEFFLTQFTPKHLKPPIQQPSNQENMASHVLHYKYNNNKHFADKIQSQ